MEAAKRARTGKNLATVEGDFDRFTEFMQELVAVPHAKIKAQMEAEKTERKAAKRSSSRDAAV
jgi:hypothetical protein